MTETSCILGAITTNGEALLYEAKKNATKGEWNEVRRAAPHTPRARGPVYADMVVSTAQLADLTSGLVNELAPVRECTPTRK